MNDKTITILQLYPEDMNIYGDWGNVLVIKKRLEWGGFTPRLISYNQGDDFPSDVDIIIGGGGQDSGQSKVIDDLQSIGGRLRVLADKGMPMLVVCGLYQLFGHFFRTRTGDTLPGIGLLDIETFGGDERMIGNIVTSSDEFGLIVGYENHSGQTNLLNDATPLGRVIRGAGNNGEDDTEGARYQNVIGTYLHGSLLPKNPAIADFLIRTAIERKYGDYDPPLIDDHFARQAREIAQRRPR